MKCKSKGIILKRISVGVLALAVLIGGAFYTYNTSKPNKSEDVEVSREREYTVEKGNIVSGIDGSGKIVLNKSTLNFDHTVTMKEIYIQVGQRINKDDKIAISSDDKILYAKAPGIVTEVGYKNGEMTKKETPVVTVAESGDIFAELTVSQDNVLNIEKDQMVYLWVSAHQGVKFSGKVDFINLNPISDNGVTSYTIRIKLDASDYELLDGMTVIGQFILKEKNDILTLSNKAIILKNDKQYVRIKNAEGVIVEKEIETGFSDGKKSEIVSGLSEGDVVIVGGQ